MAVMPRQSLRIWNCQSSPDLVPNQILGFDDAGELDLKICEKEIDEYMAQRKWLKQNMKQPTSLSGDNALMP